MVIFQERMTDIKALENQYYKIIIEYKLPDMGGWRCKTLLSYALEILITADGSTEIINI